jgi:hypothetical protein
MTFEEWWAWSPPPQNVEQLQKLQREAWNAAIASSLNAVDAVNRSNIDENDVLVYIHEDLKKLLTA